MRRMTVSYHRRRGAADMKLTRREALATLALGTVVTATHPVAARGGLVQPAAGPHSLPALPYPAAALEPHIDAQTMEIHHGRHHQAYVNNLNGALKNVAELANKPLDALLANLESVPENIRTSVRNNGGGHVNHSQFWTLLSPKAGGPPTGAIADAINSTFGSFDKFRELFNQAATTRFGSGWAWLSDEKGKLVVHSTANQDTPSMDGRRGIMGLDVWEHAYYLKYQNRRPDYVNAWWNIVNWSEVNRRLKG
jgi:Fe-Mn family superoxide dismutase